MSIFRADFKPLKRTILPNISKTIIQMQGILIYRVYHLLRSLNFFYENLVDYQLNQNFFNCDLYFVSIMIKYPIDLGTDKILAM